MAQSISTQAVVIGAGPGGYVAAIRLGQLGVKTVIIEKQYLGGVCLNVGCIPSKALIHAAKTADKMRHSEDMGISAGEVNVDMTKVQKWKSGIVKKLTSGVGQLCKANGAKVLQGAAKFISDTKLEVTDKNGKVSHEVSFENAIIATGSRPTEVPVFPFDHEYILDSTDGLALEELPESLIVLGGGYIGLELGMTYAKFGSKVTVVEMQQQVLPGFDKDVSQIIARKLKKLKVDVKTGTPAEKVETDKNGVTLHLKGGEKVTAEKMLVSVGRKPVLDGFGLESLGLEMTDDGFIAVSDEMRTSKPHIFAIGDVVGQPMLAHKASYEGEIAAEVIAGHKAGFDAQTIPAVVFTDPEVATTGISEKDAEAEGIEVITGKFPFAALGRALTTNDTDGFVKVIAEKDSHLVRGIAIVGNGASVMISEGTAIIEMAATLEDLALSIHPHPTLSEAMMEAAKAALGGAIHIVNK